MNIGRYEINLGGGWKPLGAEEDAFLAGLIKSGTRVGELKSRGAVYKFDLDALTQTNAATKKVRMLRFVQPELNQSVCIAGAEYYSRPGAASEGMVDASMKLVSPRRQFSKEKPTLFKRMKSDEKPTLVQSTLPIPVAALSKPPTRTATLVSATTGPRIVEVWLAGEWKKLSIVECEEISSNLAAGKEVCEISSRGIKYRFDFEQMMQTNLASGRTRNIRFSGIGASGSAAALGFDVFRDEYKALFSAHGRMTEKLLYSAWPSETGPLWDDTAKQITKEMDLRVNGAVDMVEFNHYWTMERDSPSFHAGKEVNDKLREALRKDPQVLGRMQMHFETGINEDAEGDTIPLEAHRGLTTQALNRICQRLVDTPKDVPEKKWAQEVLKKHKDGEGLDEDVELSYYDFLNVMLGRKKHKVSLWMYDISDGIAKRWSWLLLGQPQEGIWHTGVVVDWPDKSSEFWFGGSLFESPPGNTPFGEPLEKRDLGFTYKPRQEVWEYIVRHCTREFTSENYDVLTHNCNHFTDKLTMHLQNKHIPDEVRLQPERLMSTFLAKALRPMLNQWLGGFNSADGARATDKKEAEELWGSVLTGALVQFERDEGGRPLVGEVRSSTEAECTVRVLDFRSRSETAWLLQRASVTAVLRPAAVGVTAVRRPSKIPDAARPWFYYWSA